MSNFYYCGLLDLTSYYYGTFFTDRGHERRFFMNVASRIAFELGHDAWRSELVSIIKLTKSRLELIQKTMERINTSIETTGKSEIQLLAIPLEIQQLINYLSTFEDK